ncbi:hypothetical protein HD806DRAFT_532990 [Xylariaceae sp. AK1471]|nr:hypothetical protein HD806DRAFT_532990 [Xylariaceae sp. AK1471]
MPVIYTLPPPKSNTWYLAYGSNMSTDKFIKNRRIAPLNTAVVTVPGWALMMDSAGVPYSEPSYGSMSPIGHYRNAVQLIGTAYQLTPEMYAKVLSSEGGGIAYAEVEVRAQIMPCDKEKQSTNEANTIAVRSLVTVMRREARPSIRYMRLLRTGADEAEMPPSYQAFLAGIPVYHPSSRLLPRIGAELFLAFWVPIMSLAERITKASLQRRKTGNAPIWVIALVRTIVFAMWFYHDYIHAPIWGRGDGMGHISL